MSNADRVNVWTPDQDEIIRDMFMGGASAAQMAERLGVSRNAVIGRCHRIGLTQKNLRLFLLSVDELATTDSTMLQILEMNDRGESISSIGNAVKLHPLYVERVIMLVEQARS